MFKASQLSVPLLRFSADDGTSVTSDKLRGLRQFGPYKRVEGTPTFAFVFPKGRSSEANSLYRALASGVDLFKGFPTVFRMAFAREQMLPITGFSLDARADQHERAEVYSAVVQSWLATNAIHPDLVFLLHDRTPDWQDDSPYHSCKKLLLARGIVSQSVTFDLLSNSTQFGWAAANIALAAFCKLGGVPWVVHRDRHDEELILGVGRAESVEPEDRTRHRTTAFTTCLTSRGEFKFSSIGRTCSDRQSYIASLAEAVKLAIVRVGVQHSAVHQLSIYVTKEFGHDEMDAVAAGVAAAAPATSLQVYVLKVTQEERFFVLDTESKFGVPRRGTCIELSPKDALLYTEGSDDQRTWRNRLPTAVRVRQYPSQSEPAFDPMALHKVLDLSQVNFRGFNASSRPAVLVYAERVARLLESGVEIAHDGNKSLDRMWFL